MNEKNEKNEKNFLTYKEFMEKVGNKRAKAIGMTDISMMKFDKIYQNKLTGNYKARVCLRRKYHKNYSFRDEHAVMDNACIIHWGQWLNIGIMTKLFPNLLNAYFFVTYVNSHFREPCFIDHPLDFEIQALILREGKKKHEFSFLNQIKSYVIYRVNFTVMKEEPEVMKYYYEKHFKKIKED